MKIVDFPDFLRQHWETIRQKLLDGSYAPSPVRRVEIPKADGTKRPLRAERSETGGVDANPTSSANPDGSGSSHPTSDRPNPDTDL